VHERTRSVRGQIRRLKSVDDQIAALQNSYEDLTCLVVSCGPSLASVRSDALHDSLSGIPTIAVKQAIDVTADETDFHCWNPFNVTRFSRGSEDTIRCFVDEPTGRIIQWNRADIRFPQVPGQGDLGRSVAHSGDFASFRLDRSVVRPFGPGIMYELVLHLAVHLGFREIITIGWDVASPSGQNIHFYDAPPDREFFEAGRASATVGNVRHPRVPEGVRRAVRAGRTYARHRRGLVYNRTTPLPGESDLVGQSTKDVVEWLTSERVSLRSVTESTYLDPRIERLSPTDLVDHLRSLS
jgi:hypothetical protein